MRAKTIVAAMFILAVSSLAIAGAALAKSSPVT